MSRGGYQAYALDRPLMNPREWDKRPRVAYNFTVSNSLRAGRVLLRPLTLLSM
jgi:hypothetical protein